MVDTAKLILASFPQTTRLVVGGIGREHQPALGEMLDAASNAANGVNGKKCLILFPTDDARTFEEIEREICKGDASRGQTAMDTDDGAGWDVIVIDGTWSQARKLHAKYLGESKGNLRRVQLSDDTVRMLDGAAGGAALKSIAGAGHQLRRHPIKVSMIRVAICGTISCNALNDVLTNCSRASIFVAVEGDKHPRGDEAPLGRYASRRRLCRTKRGDGPLP